MRPNTLSALALSVLLAAVPAAAQQPAPDAVTSEAMMFVAGFSDQHLAGMLASAASRSGELTGFAETQPAALDDALTAEIGIAVARHGPEWQRNMARAWDPLLSTEAFASLTVAGAQSPYLDEYLALRAKAGEAMRALSEDLFADALRGVVSGTVARLGEPPPASQ